MAHRAKTGGEYGANGEWYKGGQFAADNPDTAKGGCRTSGKGRKIEIEPFRYIAAGPGEFAVMALARAGAGTVFADRERKRLIFAENWQEIADSFRLSEADRRQVAEAVAAYNAGFRIAVCQVNERGIRIPGSAVAEYR